MKKEETLERSQVWADVESGGELFSKRSGTDQNLHTSQEQTRKFFTVIFGLKLFENEMKRGKALTSVVEAK